MLKKSRKIILYSFCISLITLFSNGYARSSKDTLNIIHTSDVHLLFSLDECNPVFYRNRMHYLGNGDSLKAFFNIIPRKLNADAVIFTGDNVDYYQAESKSGGFVGSQIERFRKFYDMCPVPLYLTLGNHDIETYTINKNDSSKNISQYFAYQARASWIRNIPCFYNGTYYSKVFKVGKTKYHFIFLDNGYKLREGSRTLDKIQLDWLNDKVKNSGDDPIILLFHIYFPVGDINGDGIFFSSKNSLINWPNKNECSTGILKTINENKNIKVLLVGHGHKNLFEKITFPSGNQIYQVETGSVKDSPDNWRLMQLTQDKIIISKPGDKGNQLIIESK